MKKTLIIGASNNPDRYAYKAAHMLRQHGHEIVLVSKKKGKVADIEMQDADKIFTDIDTITLYIGAVHQPEYFSYILRTKPKRLIFNPGTENEELATLAIQNGIKPENACTLVLLSTGQY